MPQFVSEITSGAGESADSKTRSFRIVLSSPTEAVSIEAACGVSVGSLHPADSTYECTTYSASYEGESRLVLLATFTYGPVDDQSGSSQQPPDARPAKWSLGSSLYERPVTSWRRRNAALQWDAEPRPAGNPVGDMYDGVTTLDALVTINIEQFVLSDATEHASYVGAINEETITLGSLAMEPHTVMLRGVKAEPSTVPYGGELYRGWLASYEFAYKKNTTAIHFGTNGIQGYNEVSLGWDIAVPQTGFNVKLFNPAAPEPNQDVFGQPLKHSGGKIVKVNNQYQLMEGANVGDKARGMVLVYEYEDGGASQTPCALPIPLNDDGDPRKITDVFKPLVRGYQVHRAINITNTLKLRLS